jgi:acetate---CoA ligase (ADP-forming)
VSNERQTVALTRLLRPRSVAIIGISAPSQPSPASGEGQGGGSLGANVLDNLTRIGFAGDIHLVSRTNKQIAGRVCLASIDELPEGIDAAVLAVPRQATVEAIAACARRKVGAALVFASGFAEMDDEGRTAQEAMARIARDHSIALCGPNCIGFVNLTDKVALTFEPLSLPPPFPPPQAGEGKTGAGRGIGVITQSGAMCSTLRLALAAKDLALSTVVSTGNEAQLTTEDFLAFLIDDDATHVIVLFMEEVRRRAQFLALAARARAKNKPIVLMHPGRSKRAQASARSHTGAMTDNHAVMAALVGREAVVLVETLDELIDTAEIFARFAQAPTKGAAVMTNSGAFKGYALDLADTIGLDLPALSPDCAAGIKNVLPPFAAIENPVDVTAMSIRDAGILGRTAAHLLADPAMGSLLVAIVAGAPRFAIDKANAIVGGIADLEKPVAIATMGDETPLPAEFVAALRQKGLAFFRSPDRALRALARTTWYGNAVRTAQHRAEAIALPQPLPQISHAVRETQAPSGALAEHQGKAFVAALGIAVPRGELARDPDEALAIARRIGFPVALKAQAALLAHKSDAGGVALNIADAPALTRAWHAIAANVARKKPGLLLDGMLVEAMAAPGLEMVVSARRERGWGPILTVGLGGLWIEALADVRLLAADLPRDAIIAELRKLKGAALLPGHRGAPPADLDAVAECALRLGALLRADLRIAEIEINPLVVYAKGALALDVLMQVAER